MGGLPCYEDLGPISSIIEVLGHFILKNRTGQTAKGTQHMVIKGADSLFLSGGGSGSL